jgi:hypothetical protein
MLQYAPPKYVVDGMPVFAPIKAPNRIGLVPCRVESTLGDYVGVLCEDPPCEGWFKLEELRVIFQKVKP